MDLSGSPTLTASTGFAAAPGNIFTIITSTSGLTGSFSGLANNAFLTISGQLFEISYSSTSVVLTRTSNSTTTTVASSTNPAVFGQPVSFMATITPSNPSIGTPTGTVQFQVDGANFGSPVMLTNGVAASSLTSNLPVGGHTVTAVYSGDTNFAASTSVSTAFTVNPANTLITITSSPNPSVFSLLVGFTAVVQAFPPAGGTPGGTVTLRMGRQFWARPISTVRALLASRQRR